jgi:hypothetical protein
MDEGRETMAEERDGEGASRRNLLRMAALGIGGATAAAVATAQPAAANDPNDITIGVSKTNTSTNPTELDSTGVLHDAQVLFQSGNAFAAANSARDAALAGWASSDGTANTGVYGYAEVDGGAAVVGIGSNGAADLQLPVFSSGVPSSGTHSQGQFFSRSDGLFFCVGGGTPGSFRKITGPSTAGALHTVNPARVFDSRFTTPVTASTTRTVSIKDGRNSSNVVITPDVVPAGATAVVVNVTITTTVGAGFVVVHPGGTSQPAASTVNWFASNQTFANQITIGIDASRQVNVTAGGAIGTSTNVILDVSGFYL